LSVKRLVQVTYQIWTGWIGESRGLTVEDGLTKSVVEEGVLHIKLLNRRVAGGSNGEHRVDISVNPEALCETSEDPARLVAIESPVR
jgi:hypothetical protein